MLFAGNLLRHPAYARVSHRVVGELARTDEVLDRGFFAEESIPGSPRRWLNTSGRHSAPFAGRSYDVLERRGGRRYEKMRVPCGSTSERRGSRQRGRAGKSRDEPLPGHPRTRSWRSPAGCSRRQSDGSGRSPPAPRSGHNRCPAGRETQEIPGGRGYAVQINGFEKYSTSPLLIVLRFIGKHRKA